MNTHTPPKKGLARVCAIASAVAVATTGCESRSVEQMGTARSASISVTSWAERQLPSSDPDPANRPWGFGQAVAIRGDTALVGAPGFMVNGVPAGAVFPFGRGPSGWVRETTLAAPPSAQAFGRALSFTDGHVAIAGTTESTESVWVFAHDAQGFSLEDVVSAAPLTSMGASLAVALEGNTLLVGAGFVTGTKENEGTVYVHELTSGRWSLAGQLWPDESGAAGASFGFRVALCGDRALVTALGEDAGVGAVYVFERSEATVDPARSWAFRQRLSAPPESPYWFGYSIACSASTVFVGAPADLGERGVVYAFTENQGAWVQAAALASQAGEPYDYLGWALGLSKGLLFASAPGAKAGEVYSGRIQAFALDGGFADSGILIPSDGTNSSFFGVTLAVSPGATVVSGAGSLPNVYGYLPTQGSSCTADYECSSGHCSEGVCCDSACSEPCRSCLGSRKRGGTGTTGICEAVDEGADPRDGCAVSAEECGTTGACNGAGQCAKMPRDTPCGASTCVTPTQSVSPGQCDGNGTCSLPSPTSCQSGYACQTETGSCAVSCSGSDACDEASGYYCLQGACVSGARCSEDRTIAIDATGSATSCASVLCTGGVCPEECERTSDCVAGLVCDPYSHACVPEAALSQSQSADGVTCRSTRAPASRRSYGWIGTAAIPFIRRLRRRVRSTRAGT